MTDYSSLIRLYIPTPLKKDGTVELTPRQSYYSLNVMRQDIGDKVRLFNGKDGEFIGEITSINKRIAQLKVKEKICPQEEAMGISLLFSPLKGERLGFLIEKATELGVNEFYPVFTERTVPSHINFDKLDWRAIEAAEQCERMTLPIIHDAMPLEELLAKWDVNIPIFFCEERSHDQSLYSKLSSLSLPCAFLIGPEGGFTSNEKETLHRHSFVHPIHLGKRILRSETAALMALSFLQVFLSNDLK